MKVGNRTVTLDGPANLVRWSANGTPTVEGELGMNVANGRPSALIFGDSRELAGLNEGVVSAAFRTWAIQQNGGLTTLNQMGFTTAPTVTGTATNLNTSTGQFIDYASAAVLDNDAGWISSAFSQTRFDYRPNWRCAMRTGPVITVVRYWLGMFSATPIASDDPTVHGFGFRFSTSAGDVNWMAWSNDNSGGGTIVDTGIPVVADTSYLLVAIVNAGGGSIRYYINDVLVATISTNLPGAANNLGHVERLRTLEAVAKSIRLSKVALSQRGA